MYHYVVKRSFGLAFYREGRQYGAATNPLDIAFFYDTLTPEQSRSWRKHGIMQID